MFEIKWLVIRLVINNVEKLTLFLGSLLSLKIQIPEFHIVDIIQNFPIQLADYKLL